MITPELKNEQRFVIESNGEKVLGTANEFVKDHLLLESLKEYVSSGFCTDNTIKNLIETTNADYDISEVKKPKYILFDLGGVLFNGCTKSFCMWCFHKYGFAPDFSKSKVSIDHRMDTGIFSIYDLLKEQHPELPEDSRGELCFKWANVFKPRLDMLDLICFIDKNQCKVGALSNLDRYNGEYFKAQNYFKDFDKLFFSYQMKMVKPNHKIFLKIIKELELDPIEILFIDDQPDNIEVAKNWSFNTLLFDKSMHDLDVFTETLKSLGVKFI